jgi:hypothetical protein
MSIAQVLIKDEPGSLETGHGCQEQAYIGQQQDAQKNQQNLVVIEPAQKLPDGFHREKSGQ